MARDTVSTEISVERGEWPQDAVVLCTALSRDKPPAQRPEADGRDGNCDIADGEEELGGCEGACCKAPCLPALC